MPVSVPKSVWYFRSDLNQCPNKARERRMVLEKYAMLFKKPAPDGTPTVLVKNACVYEMIYRYGKAIGQPLDRNASFMERLRIARSMQLKEYPVEEQRIFSYRLYSDQEQTQQTTGDSNMKKNTKSSKSSTKATGERKQKTVGKTLGLSLSATYAHLFAQNEKLPNAKKLTDEQMVKFIKSEFPTHKSKAMEHPPIFRRTYNSGDLLKGLPKPATPSVAWKGEPAPAAAKVVSKKVVKKVKKA